MLAAVYAASLFVALVALLAGGAPMLRLEVWALRAFLIAGALVCAVAGSALLGQSHGNTTLGTVIAASLGIGGAAYAVGAVAWDDPRGLLLRRSGWAAMALAVSVPSHLTLGLPFVALLAAGLRQRDHTDRSASGVPA